MNIVHPCLGVSETVIVFSKWGRFQNEIGTLFGISNSLQFLWAKDLVAKVRMMCACVCGQRGVEGKKKTQNIMDE